MAVEHLAQRPPILSAVPLAPAELAAYLDASQRAGDVKASEAALEAAQARVGALAAALALVAEPAVAAGDASATTRAQAAASFFKRACKAGWASGAACPAHEKPAVRAALLRALCCAPDERVLRLLADAFRELAQADFARHTKEAAAAATHAPEWSSLVADLQQALASSNLMPGADGAPQSASPVLTYNVLVAVNTLLKPYQYFLDATKAREAAPQSMEAVVAALFAPLLDIFKSVAAQYTGGAAAAGPTLHVLLKALHHSVRAYMPNALRPRVAEWADVASGVLASVPAAIGAGVEDCRTHKRAVQVCLALVTRHQNVLDAARMQAMAEAGFEAAKTVVGAAAAEELPGRWEITGSYCFDLMSRLLETTGGWNLLSSHLGSIVSTAAIPALAMRLQDAELWHEDGEEFVRRCLPCDSDASSGLTEDHFTLRLAALNLMGLIAKAKGPPPGAKTRSMSKRKKGKRSATAPTGASIITPLLEGVDLATAAPFEATSPTPGASQQCAALLAWGSLKEYLSDLANLSDEGQAESEKLALNILVKRAAPAMALADPFVAAHGAWLAGEMAGLLPEGKSDRAYEGLTVLLASKDITVGEGDLEEEMSLSPLRSAAANSLSALLEGGTAPPQWAGLVDAMMGLARSEEEEESCRALALVEAAATSCASDVVAYAGPLAAALGAVTKGWLARYAEDNPSAVTEPWPTPVESGFSALAALADAYDEAVEEVEEETDARAAIEAGRATLSAPLAELLQAFWLNPWFQGPEGIKPPPSCVREGCVLVGCILKSARKAGGAGAAAVAQWRVEELVAVLAASLADFEPWAEECVQDVLVALDQILEMQEEAPMGSFARGAAPHLCALLSEGVKHAPAEGAVQLARRAHQLISRLVVAVGPQGTEAVVCSLAAAAGERLDAIGASNFARPLAVLLAACIARSPVAAAFAAAAAGCPMDTFAFVVSDSIEEGHVDETDEARILALGCARVATQSASSAGASQSLGALVTAAVAATALAGELAHAEATGAEEEEEMDDEDEDDDDYDDDEEEEEEEETEEEFLERYAQAAKDLAEEAEGAHDTWDGEEEEGCADQGELAQADVGAEVGQGVLAAIRAGVPANKALKEKVAEAGQRFPSLAALSSQL